MNASPGPSSTTLSTAICFFSAIRQVHLVSHKICQKRIVIFLRQKICQRISVMKTNNGVFVVFKTKRELKCQFSGITEIL